MRYDDLNEASKKDWNAGYVAAKCGDSYDDTSADNKAAYKDGYDRAIKGMQLDGELP